MPSALDKNEKRKSKFYIKVCEKLDAIIDLYYEERAASWTDDLRAVMFFEKCKSMFENIASAIPFEEFEEEEKVVKKKAKKK